MDVQRAYFGFQNRPFLLFFAMFASVDIQTACVPNFGVSSNNFDDMFEITPAWKMLSNLEGGSVSFARYLDLFCDGNFISEYSFEDLAMQEELPLMCESLCCMNSHFLDQSNQSVWFESLDLSCSREKTTVHADLSKSAEKSDSYEHEHLGQPFNPMSVPQFHSRENGSQSGCEELC